MNICGDNLKLVYGHLEGHDKVSLSSVSKQHRNVFWNHESESRNKIFAGIHNIADLRLRLEIPNPPLEDLLITASANGRTEIIKFLIEIFNGSYKEALYKSSENGHIEIVNLLLPLNGEHERDRAFAIACKHGHLHIVKQLAGSLTDMSELCIGLYWASQSGHQDIVKYIIFNFASGHIAKLALFSMRAASKNGHLGVIKIIANVSSTSRIINYVPLHHIDDEIRAAFSLALEYKHTNIVKFLSKHLDKPRSY